LPSQYDTKLRNLIDRIERGEELHIYAYQHYVL